MSRRLAACARISLGCAIVVGVTLSGSCAPEAEAETLESFDPQRADRRLATFQRDCARESFYDRDTSNLIPVLAEKLEKGQTEPLKRAKAELGELGTPAAEEIQRCFERNFTDPIRSTFAENALDAAAFNPTETARKLLLAGLDHPQESLRRQALLGLTARHVKPEDYPMLLGRFEGSETSDLKRQVLDGLFLADRLRAERYVLDWLPEGLHQAYWSTALPALAQTKDPDVGRRAGDSVDLVPPPFSTYLAAAGAAHGHAGARAFLEGELTAEEPGRRLPAATAAKSAGLVDLLAKALAEDASADIRVVAADGIRTLEGGSERARDWLRPALDDPSPVVRAHVLKLLVEMGDSEARARAVVLLASENSQELQGALLALREVVVDEPAMAVEAMSALLRRNSLEEHRPVQRRTATFKAIGLLPLVEAARFQRELGLKFDAETIETLRAHEWFMIQAANTGAVGRAYLAEELAREQDPLRRLDLLTAVGSQRDDLARAVLIEFVEQGAKSPWERVYAAERLIKVGPSWEVAPRLKRVSYEMEDVEARVALQCLLWTWY